MTNNPASGDRKRLGAVFISGYHDYRTPKRASIHQIADGLVRDGFDVTFISTRFSELSRHKGDSRLFLWDKTNTVEVVNGVRCMLWRTALHPFRTGLGPADAVIGKLISAYSNLPNSLFDELVGSAGYIILEAGFPTIYLRRIRRLNPTARIICYCTDRPDTVGAHPDFRRRLIEDHQIVDHFVLRSPAMADYFDFAMAPLYRSSFGIDKEQFKNIGPSPYAKGMETAVSVGSMLFDKTFFDIAAPAFPNLQFHVIGSGAVLEPAPNIHAQPEIPFADTLPFVKHASIGIAPYHPAPGVEYLADTSLKLAQFEYFGLPAVCPHFAVGASRSRIGYEPGNAQSIIRAIDTALGQVGKLAPRSFPDWSEVAKRVLEPQSFSDTAITRS